MLSSDNEQFHSSIFEIVEPFAGVLLDAYGVFWGGSHVGVLPKAKEAMQELVLKGKIVGVVSNSNQLACDEMEKLERFGLFLGVHYHFYITSAQIEKEFLEDPLNLNEEIPFFGKPSSIIFQKALKELAKYGIIDRSLILMVGDTPEIDIRGASNAQIASALVINTGVMAGRLFRSEIHEFLKKLPPSDIPTFILASLG